MTRRYDRGRKDERHFLSSPTTNCRRRRSRSPTFPSLSRLEPTAESEKVKVVYLSAGGVVSDAFVRSRPQVHNEASERRVDQQGHQEHAAVAAARLAPHWGETPLSRRHSLCRCTECLCCFSFVDNGGKELRRRPRFLMQNATAVTNVFFCAKKTLLGCKCFPWEAMQRWQLEEASSILWCFKRVFPSIRDGSALTWTFKREIYIEKCILFLFDSLFNVASVAW